MKYILMKEYETQKRTGEQFPFPKFCNTNSVLRSWSTDSPVFENSRETWCLGSVFALYDTGAQ